jgi:hypothetical protein
MYCIVWAAMWFSTPQQALDFMNNLSKAQERNSAKLTLTGNKNALVQYCKKFGNYAELFDRQEIIDTREKVAP